MTVQELVELIHQKEWEPEQTTVLIYIDGTEYDIKTVSWNEPDWCIILHRE